MHSNYIIETNDLSFCFRKSQPILDKVNIHVPEGSIYGFLGPNGAGKTTTMRLMTGILPIQDNQIRMFNQPIETQMPQLFHRIGCLIETPSIYDHLSGLNNLRIVARMQGIDEKKAHMALEWVGLEKVSQRKASQYSLGMRQRLAIGMALLHDPSLLMLDEPVNGLDPNGMLEMRELFIKLNRERGVTIFISSHLLHEVEKMCSHIGIIHKGSMCFEGKLADLSRATGSGIKIIITVADAAHWITQLQISYPDACLFESDKIMLSIQHQQAAIEINRQLVTAGAPVAGLSIQDNLEDWFMQITQN